MADGPIAYGGRHDAKDPLFLPAYLLMVAPNPAFAAFMEEQRLDYQRSLPPRVAQMQALWQEILDGKAPDDAMPALERHAHSIAGSAATFGCAPLGNAARSLEMILTPLVETSWP